MATAVVSAAFGGGQFRCIRSLRCGRAAECLYIRVDCIRDGAVPAAAFGIPLSVLVGLHRRGIVHTAGVSGSSCLIRRIVYIDGDIGADLGAQVSGRGQNIGLDLCGGVFGAGLADPLHRHIRAGHGGVVAAFTIGRNLAAKGQTHRRPFLDRSGPDGIVATAKLYPHRRDYRRPAVY